MSVIYNGAYYYYITNIQGDIVAITNSSGTIVVRYTYDAWGNILSTDGTMASTLGVHNPLRYRGYVYDQETGLYYLQSRYYNPEIGRFISADGYVSTGQGLLGNNMFAYCRNNPVSRKDASGTADISYTTDDDTPWDDMIPDNLGSGGAGGGGNSSASNGGTGGSPTGGGSAGNSSNIPQYVSKTLEYIDKTGRPPQGYKGGKEFANDGRNNSAILPHEGNPYCEYDVHPYQRGQLRGLERLVIGADNSVWYTADHYRSFIQMR